MSEPSAAASSLYTGRLIGLRGEDRGRFQAAVLSCWVQDDFGTVYARQPNAGQADGAWTYNEITFTQVRRN